MSHAGCLCRRVRGIRVSEARRCAATVGRIALRFPSSRAVASALWRIVAHGNAWRSVRVRDRGRRPILRKLTLTRRHAGIVWRIARTAVHGRHIVRGSIRRDRTLTHCAIRGMVHRAVHRCIPNAAGGQPVAVYRANRHMRGGLRRSGARDHGAVLDGRGRRGDMGSRIHGAKRTMLRWLEPDRVRHLRAP